jgi:hypothetical protein
MKFVDFIDTVYNYFSNICEQVDYGTMNAEYTGDGFTGDNYLEKKTVEEF